MGETELKGGVEVCFNEEWTAVCDDFWGANDARVVCRQLGLLTSGMQNNITMILVVYNLDQASPIG